jgi:hypothetical protein
MIRIISTFITRQDLTLIIAIWGAFLSSYQLISDYLKNKRSIKVELSYGFLSNVRSVGPNILSIQANNIGFRNVTLSSVGLIINKETQMIIMDPIGNVQLPHTLGEGQSCVIYKEQLDLARQMVNNGFSGKVKLVGVYKSAIGKTYKSKPIEFDIDEVK